MSRVRRDARSPALQGPGLYLARGSASRAAERLRGPPEGGFGAERKIPPSGRYSPVYPVPSGSVYPVPFISRRGTRPTASGGIKIEMLHEAEAGRDHGAAELQGFGTSARGPVDQSPPPGEARALLWGLPREIASEPRAVRSVPAVARERMSGGCA